VREETHGTWREKCSFNQEINTTSKSKKITTPITEEKLSTEVLNDELVTNQTPVNKYMETTVDFGALNDEEGEMSGHEGALPGTAIPALAPIVQGSRKSSRKWKPTAKYLERMQQETINLSAAASISE
jgi:hypothetical protein